MAEYGILSRESAERLCEAIDLNSEFFDESNADYISMKKNDPIMLLAMQELFSIANEDETPPSFT